MIEYGNTGMDKHNINISKTFTSLLTALLCEPLSRVQPMARRLNVAQHKIINLLKTL